MRPAPEAWTPLGVAVRRIVEGIVVRNPHLEMAWIKPDRTQSEVRRKAGIS